MPSHPVIPTIVYPISGFFANPDNMQVDNGVITAISSGAAGTGTVTSIATGTGLTGGPITTTGTISLSPVVTAAMVNYPASVTFNAEGQITATTAFGSSPITTVNGNNGISATVAGVAATIGISNSGVTAASYTNANITVNARGQVTAASNGSGGGGNQFALLSNASTAQTSGAGYLLVQWPTTLSSTIPNFAISGSGQTTFTNTDSVNHYYNVFAITIATNGSTGIWIGNPLQAGNSYPRLGLTTYNQGAYTPSEIQINTNVVVGLTAGDSFGIWTYSTGAQSIGGPTAEGAPYGNSLLIQLIS